MVPYEGSKSHLGDYNFCHLCKERLDTCLDELDEGWYFVNTRQVRFVKSPGSPPADARVVNVHTSCLKEIQMNFTSASSGGDSSKPPPAAKAKAEEHQATAGAKRTYVDAQRDAEEGRALAGVDSTPLKYSGLKAIVSGLDSLKRRRMH